MANETIHHEYSISWSALFRIALVFVGFYLFWQLHTIIISIAIIIPNFIDQFPGLLTTLNAIFSRATLLPESFRHIDLTQYAENGVSYLVNSSSKITGFITTFITILFMTLYILIDSNRLRSIFIEFFPDEKRDQIQRLIKEIYIINGHYIRGNLLISTICTTIISIGLLSLNIPYAIPLGIFAGILDLLPLIGALTGAIPALIIGFAISPTTGFLVLLLFIFYQQVENNLLAPNVYKRLLDLSPSLSLLSVLIGATTFGVTGAFVALPIAASIPTIVKFATRENIIKKR